MIPKEYITHRHRTNEEPAGEPEATRADRNKHPLLNDPKSDDIADHPEDQSGG